MNEKRGKSDNPETRCCHETARREKLPDVPTYPLPVKIESKVNDDA
jgi:hypothetical protein